MQCVSATSIVSTGTVIQQVWLPSKEDQLTSLDSLREGWISQIHNAVHGGPSFPAQDSACNAQQAVGQCVSTGQGWQHGKRDSRLWSPEWSIPVGKAFILLIDKGNSSVLLNSVIVWCMSYVCKFNCMAASAGAPAAPRSSQQAQDTSRG